MHQFFRANYKPLALQLYWVIYLVWFSLLERNIAPHFWMDGPLDKLVPFCEWFVFPYLIWFPYMLGMLLYFLRHSLTDYYRLCFFLFAGMTICLLIYTLLPNGQGLRPLAMPRDNLACRLVQMIYQADTPTNVAPSIHVLNSVGVHLVLSKSRCFQEKPLLRGASLVLAVAICLSTVFIKQHAVVDGLLALLLSLPLYFLTYRVGYRVAFRAA